MRNIIIYAFAITIALFSVNNVRAHDAIVDSDKPVDLGSRFSFPHKDTSRLVCNTQAQIEQVLSDIGKHSSTRAHHLLFHIRENKRAKSGKFPLKRGLTKGTMEMVKRECKYLLGTKFAPVEVIKEIDSRGFKVSIVSVYESYRDKEGIFYTWFVNTELLDAPSSITQRAVGSGDWGEKIVIGETVLIPKGMMALSNLETVRAILASTRGQPRVVGRKVMEHPLEESVIAYHARQQFEEDQERGWAHRINRNAQIVFTEYVESYQIHGRNVSILAFEIPATPSGEPYKVYTWVLDAVIIEPESRKQASR